jgi:hypothetical protein
MHHPQDTCKSLKDEVHEVTRLEATALPIEPVINLSKIDEFMITSK